MDRLFSDKKFAANISKNTFSNKSLLLKVNPYTEGI